MAIDKTILNAKYPARELELDTLSSYFESVHSSTFTTALKRLKVLPLLLRDLVLPFHHYSSMVHQAPGKPPS
jgi:hypothetical protein